MLYVSFSFSQVNDLKEKVNDGTIISIRLIPNMNLLDDDSPTLQQKTVDGISEGPEGHDSLDSIREPFSDDLQLVSTEVESPLVTRKRRKLPELPKNSRNRCKDYKKRRKKGLLAEYNLFIYRTLIQIFGIDLLESVLRV